MACSYGRKWHQLQFRAKHPCIVYARDVILVCTALAMSTVLRSPFQIILLMDGSKFKHIMCAGDPTAPFHSWQGIHHPSLSMVKNLTTEYSMHAKRHACMECYMFFYSGLVNNWKQTCFPLYCIYTCIWSTSELWLTYAACCLDGFVKNWKLTRSPSQDADENQADACAFFFTTQCVTS